MNQLDQALTDAAGALWLAIGAGLVTAPRKTMSLAGISLRGGPMLTVGRILGLRDLALGSAILLAEDGPTRQKILRGAGAMCVAEGLFMPVLRGQVPVNAIVRLMAASGGGAALSFAASRMDDDGTSTGVPEIAAGYLLAVAPTLELVPVVRERRTLSFVAFEAGCALLTLGFLRRKNAGGARNNAAAGLIACAIWAWRAVRERRTRLQSRGTGDEPCMTSSFATQG